MASTKEPPTAVTIRASIPPMLKLYEEIAPEVLAAVVVEELLALETPDVIVVVTPLVVSVSVVKPPRGAVLAPVAGRVTVMVEEPTTDVVT